MSINDRFSNCYAGHSDAHSCPSVAESPTTSLYHERSQVRTSSNLPRARYLQLEMPYRRYISPYTWL